MSGTNVHVKIGENDACIFENNNTVESSASNLSGLISCLKDTQLKINDFLTSLVEKRDGSASVQNRLTSDSDSDFEEEIELNPKKCKLID